jgi:hypothetical protein
MKSAYFVWTDRTRPPSIADLTAKLGQSGHPCRAHQPTGDGPNSTHWTEIRLEPDASDSELCTISVSLPSADEIDEMRQTYDTLPFQVKNAARKYKIEADGDDYGQAGSFQLQVVAVMTRLTNGVIDDPQESGLTMLDEFEEYIR